MKTKESEEWFSVVYRCEDDICVLVREKVPCTIVTNYKSTRRDGHPAIPGEGRNYCPYDRNRERTNQRWVRVPNE